MPGSGRMLRAVPRAVELVGAVRAGDGEHVRGLLDAGDVEALAVALAAMVDDSKPASHLLAWTGGIDLMLDGWSWAQVLEAHSAYERWRARGLAERVPPAVREGQRIYDKVKARRRRRQARESVA